MSRQHPRSARSKEQRDRQPALTNLPKRSRVRWMDFEASVRSVLQKASALGWTLAERVSPMLRHRRWLERDRAHLEERDEASFKAAALPEGEVIGIRCVWVVEVYLASHVSNLASRLRELGLDKKDVFGRSRPVDQILAVRSRGGSPYSMSLGFLVPRNRSKGLGVSADLPAGVISVFLNAVTLVQGATILVAQFRFEDAVARQVEEPFRTRYQSIVVRKDGRVSYPFGVHQRQEAVDEIRAGLRRRCEMWMRSTLPGAFSGFVDEMVPASELLTLELGDPLNGREPARWEGREIKGVGKPPEPESPVDRGFGDEDYMTILDQRGVHDAWSSADIPGLVLRFPRSETGFATDKYLVLSASVPALEVELGTANKERTPENVVHRTYWLSKTLAVFALARLVAAIDPQIRQIQDRLGQVSLGWTRRALAEMQELERDLAKITRDTRPLLHGIVGAHERVWRWDVADFVPFESDEGEANGLFSGMAGLMIERSRNLLAAEEDVRTAVHGISGLVAAAANIAAARSNPRWQRAAIVISALAALLAALAIPGVLDAVKQHLLR